MKTNVGRVFMFFFLLLCISVTSCAWLPKRQDNRLKDPLMMVNEDKDLDFLRIEEVSSEEGPSGGCPT